jgi:hypothetical protein
MTHLPIVCPSGTHSDINQDRIGHAKHTSLSSVALYHLLPPTCGLTPREVCRSHMPVVSLDPVARRLLIDAAHKITEAYPRHAERLGNSSRNVEEHLVARASSVQRAHLLV